VPVIARATPPLLVRLFRAAKLEGLGAAFGASVSGWAALTALALALVVALAALHAVAVPVFAVSVLSALALTRFFAARVSGITGDVLGAAIEVAELAGLLTVSAWAHLVR